MPLSEVVELQRGLDLPVQSRKSGNVGVYGSNGAVGQHDTAAVNAPGVVIGRSGVIGGAQYIKEPFWPLNTTLYVKDFKSNDARWVYYTLKSIDFSRFDSGSAQPSLNRNYIADIPITVPPIDIQRRISSALGALDDKIESNRSIARLASDLAIAVLSGPGSSIRVGDIGTISKGLSYKGSGLAAKDSHLSVPIFSLASFTRIGLLAAAEMKYYTGEYKFKHKVHPWELLIANTDLTPDREILGRGFIVPEGFKDAIHTHHTSVVRFPSNPDYGVLLWAQLQSRAFRSRAQGFATGTTVAALPPETVLDFELCIPDDSALKIENAKTLLRTSWQAQDEIQKLLGLRDTLLPGLLSGRVQVGEVAT